MLQRSHYKLWGTINQAVTTATAHQLPTGLGVNIVSILDQYACLSVLSIAHYVNVTRHSKHQQLCHSGQPTPHTVVADDRQKGHQTPFKQLRYSMASVSQQQEAKQMSRHRSQVSGLQQCRDAMGICRQLHHVPVPLLCQQWQSTNNINQDNHKRQLKQRCVHQQQGLSWFLQHKRQPQLSITAPLPYSTQHALRHISSQQQQQRASGSSLLSLPNLLSLSRVAAGPWVSYLIATHQWPLAVGLTAAAGVTDWLDGYLARRLGHTSKLGSYLDPFADKVLIGCVVSTMGYLDMVPAWLAVLVVGRDAAQISGMVWYRWHMMGRRWPGFTAFLDVDCTDSSLAGSGPLAASTSEQAADDSSGGIDPAQANAAEPAGLQQLPQIKPLMVSKVNTALVFALIAGSAAQQWQGVPGHEVLELLEYVVAGTTVVSAAWYVRLYSSGKLLPPMQHKQSGFAE